MDVETYTPGDKQAGFHASGAKYRLLLGGAGGGKSTALVWECILTALDYPGSKGMLARETYPAFLKSTWQTFFDQCPAALIAKHVKSEGREEIQFTNGSKLWFMALDDPLKLGSIELDYAAVDEVVEVSERIFLTLITRLRGRVGPRRLFCATNPPDEDHYLYRFFVEAVSEEPALAADRLVVHASTYDNQEHLDADYVRELERQPPAWREKFLHGHWGFLADGKPVFQEFDPRVHVEDLVPLRTLPIVRGWDFGWHHPACLWVQRTPTGHIHWLHELQGTDEELRSFARRVVQETERLFPRHEVQDYCDIAGTQKNDRGPTAVQVLRNEFGITPSCRKLGLHQSLERLRGLLRTHVNGVPLLRLNTSLRLTRKAYAGGYYVNPKTQEPQKYTLYDNLIDAGRYATVPLTQDFGVSAKVAPFKRPNWRLAV